MSQNSWEHHNYLLWEDIIKRPLGFSGNQKAEGIWRWHSTRSVLHTNGWRRRGLWFLEISHDYRIFPPNSHRFIAEIVLTARKIRRRKYASEYTRCWFRLRNYWVSEEWPNIWHTTDKEVESQAIIISLSTFLSGTLFRIFQDKCGIRI